MDILCILHDQEEYGIIRWPLTDIAKAVGTTKAKIKSLVEKGVMKGADSGATVQPLIYTPRSGRLDGDPITLVAEQNGPIWYSSRMIIDEHKRMARGFSASSKGTPMPSPKGGLGEGIGEGEQADKQAEIEKKQIKNQGTKKETQPPPSSHTGYMEAEPCLIADANLTDQAGCGAGSEAVDDFGKFGKFEENFVQIPKNSAHEVAPESNQIHDNRLSEKLNCGLLIQESGNDMINNEICNKLPAPTHSPKGGLGEGFGVGIDAAPKPHLTIHPSCARPSSSSSSSSSKEKEKNIQKRSGEHSGHLPTESADIENKNSPAEKSPSSFAATETTTGPLGHQNQNTPHSDTSGQEPAVQTDSARNIQADMTTDGNIGNVIAPCDPGPKYPEGFETFWAAYPVHNGKKPCAAVFARKRLANSLPAIIADIALRKTKNQRWLNGFYTNPLTYLNQELWLDDWVSSPALCTSPGASPGHQPAPSTRPTVTRL